MPEHQGVQIPEEQQEKIVDKVLAQKKQIGLGLAVVVIGLLLYLIISYLQERADRKAWTDIFTAQFTAQRENKPEAALLEKVITECKGAQALFYAQMIRYGDLGASMDSTNLVAAGATCEEFLAQFPKHPLADQVRVDYGTILANLGKFAEASEQYAKVAQDGPEYLRGDAALFQAICLEKTGKEQEALTLYERITSPSNASFYGDIANEYAAYAKAMLIQKQNQPAAPVTAGEQPATDTPVAKPAEAPATDAKDVKTEEAKPATPATGN